MFDKASSKRAFQANVSMWSGRKLMSEHSGSTNFSLPLIFTMLIRNLWLPGSLSVDLYFVLCNFRILRRILLHLFTLEVFEEKTHENLSTVNQSMYLRQTFPAWFLASLLSIIVSRNRDTIQNMVLITLKGKGSHSMSIFINMAWDCMCISFISGNKEGDFKCFIWGSLSYFIVT